MACHSGHQCDSQADYPGKGEGARRDRDHEAQGNRRDARTYLTSILTSYAMKMQTCCTSSEIEMTSMRNY